MKSISLLTFFVVTLFASSDEKSFSDQVIMFLGEMIFKGIALIVSPFMDEPYWVVNDCIPKLEYISTPDISFYVLPNYQTPLVLFPYEKDKKFYRLMIVDKNGEKEIIEGAKKTYEHGYYKDYTKLPVGTVLTTTGEILDSDLSPFTSRHISVRGIVDNKIVWFSIHELQEYSSSESNSLSKNYINNTILKIENNQYIGDKWECTNQ